MKLSKNDREELRKGVEILLEASPDNKKIQLSNETLEQLLFDTYVVNKEKGIKIKIPVWSGDFLRKLDLSRVSFEDVSWFLLETGVPEVLEDYIYFDKLKEIHHIYISGKYVLNYTNTNAKIDLNKSFEAKNCNKLCVSGCNFKNVSFLNPNIDEYGYVTIWFDGSDVSNTNLKFGNSRIFVSGGNFSNVDLSNIHADAFEIIDGNFYETNLTNTRLNLTFNKESLNSLEDPFDLEYYKEGLKNHIENYWGGCYLNGKLIKTSVDKKKSAAQNKEEYDEFKSGEFASVLSSIVKQMEQSGPKK